MKFGKGIEESSSPWMASAVIISKKSGEVWMCADYHELNKRTAKDGPCQMKFKIDCLDQPYFQNSTSIEEYPSILTTVRRLHFALVQEWDSTSFEECHLDSPVLQHPFKD